MMRHVLFICLVFCTVFTSGAASVGDPKNEHKQSVEKFQPGDMIMHHITDSHDWHILDWQDHPVSIPLPIILFHKNKGLDIFLSSQFKITL